MKQIKLKNYSTSVSAEKSIAEIEQILAQFGASAVMKEYLSDGRVRSIAFKLNDKNYKLPNNYEGVHSLLFSGKKLRDVRDASAKRDAQAYRVSWRIIKDWIHSQLSLIFSGQAEPEQVLLPYAWDGKRTLYQAFKEGLIQLPEGDKNE